MNKRHPQEQEQSSILKPTTNITTTTREKSPAVPVSNDVKFKTGLLDSGGLGTGDDLVVQDQQKQSKDESFLDELADLMDAKSMSAPIPTKGGEMHPSLVSPAVVTPSAMMVSTTSIGGSHLSSTPPGPSSSTLNLLRSILPRKEFVNETIIILHFINQ